MNITEVNRVASDPNTVRFLLDGIESFAPVEHPLISEWITEGGVIGEAPISAEHPVSLFQVAGARLVVDQDSWEVTGVERSTGIAGAFLVDTDLVYVFFSAEAVQTNTIYDVIPREGITKYPDFVEVSRPNLAELNFIVQRVQ